jgi:dTDP-4-amino-4,6-dideoxygalactose transaminase
MIPPYQLEFSPAEIDYTLTAVAAILRSGRLTLGSHTRAFEATVAEMAGVEHAVAVNSGSTALEIIYRALAAEGGTVLVPTNTNFATAAAALHAGARVELYDGGLYPDVVDIERRMGPHIVAVVVVHIGGYVSPELPYLFGICRRHGVPLVEDAAHAHGAGLHGRAAGGFGRAAAFSFFPTKVVTTGEGGVVATDDPTLAEMARVYRDQGKDRTDIHVLLGNSWRMTEFGAALGMAQMDRFSADLARRRHIIDTYTAALAGSGLAFPNIGVGSQVSGYKCVATLPPDINRDRLRAALHASGVTLARGVYERPLHRHRVFADLGGRFPVADDFAARHICLPLWRTMSDTTVRKVIDAIVESMADARR